MRNNQVIFRQDRGRGWGWTNNRRDRITMVLTKISNGANLRNEVCQNIMTYELQTYSTWDETEFRGCRVLQQAHGQAFSTDNIRNPRPVGRVAVLAEDMNINGWCCRWSISTTANCALQHIQNTRRYTVMPRARCSPSVEDERNVNEYYIWGYELSFQGRMNFVNREPRYPKTR